MLCHPEPHPGLTYALRNAKSRESADATVGYPHAEDWTTGPVKDPGSQRHRAVHLTLYYAHKPCLTMSQHKVSNVIALHFHPTFSLRYRGVLSNKLTHIIATKQFLYR